MNPNPRGGAASRLAAVATVAVLAFAGALAWPGLRGVAPQSETSPEAPMVRGAERIGSWLVEADVTLLRNLGYRLDVRLTRDLAAPLPDRIRPAVELEMDGMSSIEPPLALMGPGLFRAEGALPMAGRWHVRVGFDDEFLEVVVDVPEATRGAG